MIRTKTYQNLSRSLLVVALSAMLAGAPALAAGDASYDSVYTKLNLDDCTKLEIGEPEPADGGRWACLGYNNSLVYVAEGDLRFFVSYGLDALSEKAVEQTLPGFNTINDTLEWRLIYQNGQWRPLATILRWYAQSGDGSGPDSEILVVTRLEPGGVCQVARINASLIANANEEARRFADNEVAGFDCETDRIFNVPGE